MSATASTPQTDPYRLLVVDDSRAMQAILRRVLQSGGLGATDIRMAATGEEALEALPEFKPHLVISDWHMPRMSGIEMLQTLRQTGATTLPVGFVTTETQEQVLVQAQSNAAAFILHKPFRDEDLIQAVSAVLNNVGKDVPAAPNPVAQDVRLLIQKQLPAAPFRMVEGETFGQSHLSTQNLLAVYVTQASGAICAIAAADISAVCMLGSGNADPKEVRARLRDGRPTDDMVQRAIAFFREAAELLPAHFDVPAATCKGANLVPKDFAKLRVALESARQRGDYRLSVPGYGDGRFVFIKT